MFNSQYSLSQIKSPCVKECPDRSADCRSSCEKHKAYEAAKAAERENRKPNAGAIADGYVIAKKARIKQKRRKKK